MKYCVSGRQPYSVLKKADEVKVQYSDINRIIDFIDRIPDKTIILDIPLEEKQFPWDTLQMYNENLNLVLGIHNIFLASIFAAQGYKWYWPYPITSFDELREVVKLEPAYILLGSPLCFALDRVAAITNIPVRMTANVAYEPYIPRENGLTGRYVRPEDTEYYSKWISVLEFIEPSLDKEATLLHIYKEQQSWPGNLNLLVKELNMDVDNRALPEDFAERRANCGQRCKENGICRFCDLAFRYANTLRNEHYKRKKKDN